MKNKKRSGRRRRRRINNQYQCKWQLMSDQEGATMDSLQSAVYISKLQSEHMLPID
jgi:hypothetical protein